MKETLDTLFCGKYENAEAFFKRVQGRVDDYRTKGYVSISIDYGSVSVGLGQKEYGAIIYGVKRQADPTYAQLKERIQTLEEYALKADKLVFFLNQKRVFLDAGERLPDDLACYELADLSQLVQEVGSSPR